MKIGILTWDLALRGGTQRQIVELARELKRAGDTVVIYAIYYDPEVYPDILEGIPIRYFFSGNKLARGINERKIFGIYFRALPLLFEEWRLSSRIAAWVDAELDILNPHDNHVFQAAAEWRRQTKKPVVWMMNDFPTIVLPATRFRSRLLNSLYDHLNGKLRIRSWYERSIREMDRIVVLDDGISRKYLEEQFGIHPVTIRSGLDISKFTYTPRRPFVGDRSLEILSTGIFFPHRRLEDIVEAIRILKNRGQELTWRHVGSGELHPEYEKTIRRHVDSAGISSVCIFLGRISDAELVRLYQSADIFLFPNDPQTWGLAVFEAMACGTPVVVSKGAGASEVLTDGIDSLLIDPCRPDQLAAAIKRLASSPDEWLRLSLTGRKFVEENITWPIYASNMRRVMARCHENSDRA